MTRLPNVEADEQGTPLSAVDAPFSCRLPRGELQIAVTGYSSPRDDMSCGAAEAWGLRVRAGGHVVQEIPTESPRACHSDTFNPFQGWVEGNAERVVVCQAERDGSTPNCVIAEADEISVADWPD